MAAQQTIITETIRGMKLAMRRRDNDSDSDTTITQPTNRGNKLKRNARHVREGRLDTTHGRSYKKRIDYAGYDRYILNENPPRFDDDGDLIDEDEYDPDDQDSDHHNANPWADTKLEDLLAPLTSCLLYTSPSPRDRQKSRMPSRQNFTFKNFNTENV